MPEIEIILKKNQGMNLLVDHKHSGNREYTENIYLDSKKGERSWTEINSQNDADNYLNSEDSMNLLIKKNGVMYPIRKDKIENIKVYSE